MITVLPSPGALDSKHPVTLDPASVAHFADRVARKGVTLSRNSVAEHLTCPSRWAFRAVERQVPGGYATDALTIGSACHSTVARVLSGDLPGDAPAVTRALRARRVPADRLALTVEWVLWACAFATERGGRIVAANRTVRAQLLPGVQFSGKVDLVVAGGAHEVEVIDWGFGWGPRFMRSSDMAVDAGVAILRTLGTRLIPHRPGEVVVTDVHVPRRLSVSIELSPAEIERAWIQVAEVREAMLRTAESGLAEARPGTACVMCQFRRRCPQRWVDPEEWQ